MKKKIALLLAMAMMTVGLSGCAGTGKATTEELMTTGTVSDATTEAVVAEAEEATQGEATKGEAEKAEELAPSTFIGSDSAEIRIGSLKGPTTMGLVNLMAKTEAGEAEQNYSYEIATDASVITAKLVKGDLDIALIPANAASVLYNKTEGKIQVLNINTLGVLYCVTGNKDIKKIYGLAGKTVVMTGQGTTPEYVTKYLLNAYGITDCTIEYKSEATEVVAAITKDPELIGILPQPFATVATIQNSDLRQAFSLTTEWNKIAGSATLVTGVTVVRKDFADKNPDKLAAFMKEAEESANTANKDVAGTAELVAKYGIIEKAPVAEKAIPQCNITYIDGEKMKNGLSGYLSILEGYNPESIGGELPADDFYYIPEAAE